MENETNQNSSTLLKGFINFCLCTLLFLIMCNYFIFTKIVSLIGMVFDAVFKNLSFDTPIFETLYNIPFLSCYVYLMGVFCGVLKRLNSINIFLAIILVFGIDFLLKYSISHSFEFNQTLSVVKQGDGFSFIFVGCFLVYKVFSMVWQVLFDNDNNK